MVYSQVIDWRCCTITDHLSPNTVDLEPAKILERVPKHWTRDTRDMVVSLTDGRNIIELTFEMFLARSYPIIDGRLKIGQTLLLLEGLTISVGVKFVLEDLSQISDIAVD